MVRFISDYFAAHIFGPGFKLSRHERTFGILTVFVILGFLARKAWMLFSWWGAAKVETVPAGERMLFAVNAEARLLVLVPALALGMSLVWFFFQVIDRTRLGARILHWDEKDTEQTEAAKTANAGRILVALILGVCWIIGQAIK